MFFWGGGPDAYGKEEGSEASEETMPAKGRGGGKKGSKKAPEAEKSKEETKDGDSAHPTDQALSVEDTG